MFTEERRKKIEQCILERGGMSVLELSNMFHVSDVTIRKDLEELQKNNSIMRTHGGAVVKYQSVLDIPFGNLEVKCQKEKKLIAKKAFEYIEPGDSIIMDGSSTVKELAVLISASNLQNLTIITTSIMIAQILQNQSFSVIMVGGHLNVKMGTVEGVIAERQIAGISVDKCFIGINGIDKSFGLSTHGFQEAAIKTAMYEAAKQSFVLADHTKFNKRYLAHVTDFGGGVNYIITDRRCEGFEYRSIEEQMELIFAEDL